MNEQTSQLNNEQSKPIFMDLLNQNN